MKLFVLLGLVGLLGSVQGVIIEIVARPVNKTCVSEVFGANEPISVRATVTEEISKQFALYVLIETDKSVLLAHKRYEPDQNVTTLVYNNDEARSLSVCVDNFENFEVPVELNIKYRQHLANLENIPTSFQYDELNTLLDEVDKKISTSYNYFIQNEEYTQQIIQKGTAFESWVTLLSVIIILTIVIVAGLQIILINYDIKHKKVR